MLGVDDFSKRRGHSYATLLINMDTRKPVDVLDDREASSLAGWLREHPEVFGLHAAGRTRVSYETRPLAEVNEAIAEVCTARPGPGSSLCPERRGRSRSFVGFAMAAKTDEGSTEDL